MPGADSDADRSGDVPITGRVSELLCSRCWVTDKGGQKGRMYTFDDLIHITEELRSEHGCPWDRVQTHESLKKCLSDECEEVLEAIDKKDMENLCEELGDVLLNLVLQAHIAEEEGAFTMDDVVDGICRKMIRRHPHVFGERKTLTPEESLRLWQEIKQEEKQKEKKQNP